MHRHWKGIFPLIALLSVSVAQEVLQETPLAPATGRWASQAKATQIPPSPASSAQLPRAQGQVPKTAKEGSNPPKGSQDDPAYGYFGYSLTQSGDPNSTVYETANTNKTNVTLYAEPDVHLNASVHVGEIKLEVLNITAKVNLDAQVKGLLKFNAGVTAHVDRVRLLIQGVEARVLLEARLGNLVQILSDVLDSIDLNPIIATLANSVNQLVNTTLGEVINPIPKQNRIEPRSARIEHNILYSVNDYTGNTHTNRVLDQNGEIIDEYLDNHGNRRGTDVVGHYERDMTFNGHDIPMSRNGEAVREREYVYDPFPGLSVVSAVYINAAGKVVGTQVISETYGGGTTTVQTLKRAR